MLEKMARVLVVGAGMTGAASAALVRQHIPEIGSITIWDKGRGAGRQALESNLFPMYSCSRKITRLEQSKSNLYPLIGHFHFNRMYRNLILIQITVADCQDKST